MSRRQKQVNHAIRREISDLLTHQVNDPRIKGIISITEVNISPDLTHAKVFVSAMGTEEEKSEIFAGLAAASGFLRREIGARLKLRYTPELVFERDDSIEKGDHLLQLIDRVVTNPPDK
ncbi:MAG: 30S ribosome-binding factor RbfA [Dehalococcoidia bacterium]|nr:30S ribosome-binding factor RbfA [Dehalococcoidia bacterium]